MNQPEKIEKKLFIITAVLMAVLGAVLGLYIVQFLSVYFPELTSAQYVVSCVVMSAVLALIMLSLSRPVCRLLKKMMEKLQSSLTTRPAYKNMNIVFGIILGIAIAVLAGSILNVTAPHLPGMIYITIVLAVFAVVTYGSVCLFNHVIGQASSPVNYHRGYVITSSALSSDRVVRLVPKLLGKIAVMDVTLSIITNALTDAQLNGENTEAQQKTFDNYMELKKKADIKFANGDPTLSEIENVVALAHSHKLKIIALDRLELFDDNDVDVLYLSEL